MSNYIVQLRSGSWGEKIGPVLRHLAKAATLQARVRTAIEAKPRIINVCVGSLMDRGLPFEHGERRMRVQL